MKVLENVFVVLMDSYWVGDPGSLKMLLVGLFLYGQLIIWGRRGKKTVTIRSTTAEYIDITEACKEVLYF